MYTWDLGWAFEDEDDRGQDDLLISNGQRKSGNRTVTKIK